MARVLSFAALAAVVAVGPASNAFAQAQLTAGCTSNSFTTPSWLVNNFASQSMPELTVVDFYALNRATNVSLEVRCSWVNATTTGWQTCSAGNRTSTEHPFVASVQADNSTAWFRFNETWTCSDEAPSKPITFTAVGNSSVPLSCSTNGVTSCKSTKPLLVKAALLSPVKITPAYVNGPMGHDTKGCVSSTPAWEVAASQINLRKDEGSLQSGNAFVIIRNDLLGYTASCGGTFSSAAAPQPLSCEGQIARRNRPDKYQIETALLFEPSTFALTVNQTWFCDNQDPSQPISVAASGTTPLSLECQVFNETATTQTTTFCTGGTNGTFAGNTTSRALLQPYSLNDPLPTAESCTISSIVSPAWWFHDFQTNTTTNNSQVVTAKFGMELQTGPQSTGSFAILTADGVPYSNVSTNSSAELPWNKCVLESVGDIALAPTGCEFRYDMASRFLGLKVQWECADLDKGSPVAFSGEVRTLVPDFNCVTSATGRILCSSPDPKPWRANATSVTWQ
ncbi:hypothetical protein C8A00DRAFT_42011 [Chaetomidium leptoderma]|uniref:Uncharacterized protein n=1 Tax=Chaetomidium leptoderma TaxID=669021 RepID=A0AAN6ZYD0_9PEZI|nr:hypothetical protein C8A00DRAFT_42011 [Chaetomidium leptoderma]